MSEGVRETRHTYTTKEEEMALFPSGFSNMLYAISNKGVKNTLT
jgi:hypothetical protein